MALSLFLTTLRSSTFPVYEFRQNEILHALLGNDHLHVIPDVQTGNHPGNAVPENVGEDRAKQRHPFIYFYFTRFLNGVILQVSAWIGPGRQW